MYARTSGDDGFRSSAFQVEKPNWDPVLSATAQNASALVRTPPRTHTYKSALK